ncbi:methyltransferase domain-containing protein [Thermodesulfobacterium sp. TA1]|uniref:class I SAM-dependent methyltransferase n=1 Tax=Thermodesulfobacterium sp. TA1 TaxID=2234087 RepID=UPI00123291AB|nr:class I SAM-dependent methyltransferase [Thermodesulfobacterium sp. TA1]QER42860.1 methyltransferase domain-containing protein [Thermodesulfobacterium sp. TA1]
MRKTCRICKNRLFEKPIFELKNQPKSAQQLPDKKGLQKDRGLTLKVFQCSGCGVIQLNRKPVNYYREVIRAIGISKDMVNFRKDYFRRFIEKYDLEDKKIIEIGCGKGEYLEILNSLSVEVYGLEYSEESVLVCKNKGLKVFRGFIENERYKIKGAPYDVFLCLSFLEHIPNPNQFLRGIWRNLSDEGLGLIEVPNFDMIARKKLFSEFITDHIFYFTKDTLKTTLEINGFEVLEIKEIWYDYIISAIVRKKRKLNFYFEETLNHIKAAVENFIKKYQKVAVWGAGHQSLALLALLDLKNKVSYVVDSATFKQNKYTPATHIPIYAPERLLKDPVDCILIMAGSYSDEVANIIINEMKIKQPIGMIKGNRLKIINRG